MAMCWQNVFFIYLHMYLQACIHESVHKNNSDVIYTECYKFQLSAGPVFKLKRYGFSFLMMDCFRCDLLIVL